MLSMHRIKSTHSWGAHILCVSVLFLSRILLVIVFRNHWFWLISLFIIKHGLFIQIWFERTIFHFLIYFILLAFLKVPLFFRKVSHMLNYIIFILMKRLCPFPVKFRCLWDSIWFVREFFFLEKILFYFLWLSKIIHSGGIYSGDHCVGSWLDILLSDHSLSIDGFFFNVLCDVHIWKYDCWFYFGILWKFDFWFTFVKRSRIQSHSGLSTFKCHPVFCVLSFQSLLWHVKVRHRWLSKMFPAWRKSKNINILEFNP